MPRFYKIIIGLFFFFPLAVQAAGFPDVLSNHLNLQAIEYLQNKGIVGGYPDGTYKPGNTVNRAEFTKIIVGAKLNRNPEENASNCFPDIKTTDWFSSYVCYAKQQGIVGGYPDGTFKPASNVNFVEAAKILVNTLGVKTSQPAGSEWYSAFVEALDSSHFIPSTLGSLEQKVNRGEMAEMVWRILENKTTEPFKGLDALINQACLPIGDNTPKVDMQRVRDTWLSWYNQVRADAGLYPYVYNPQLHRTAVTWSEASKAKGTMDHKRPGTTAYYDYNAITQWFKDLGLVFKNVNTVTHTENIGWGLFNCSDSDCTDELIAAIRDTFDFYMAEKNDDYKPHYNSVMNAYFKEIGLGIAIDGNKYYLTTHYGTQIISNPLPICS